MPVNAGGVNAEPRFCKEAIKLLPCWQTITERREEFGSPLPFAYRTDPPTRTMGVANADSSGDASMSRHRFYVGPEWPPTSEDYDYLVKSPKSDWAWEYLRRSRQYQSVARLSLRKGVSRLQLATGITLTRLRARLPHAEAWGLCCFR